MKRMISLLLATALASSCGTAPHADSVGKTQGTTGSEEERSESNTGHYLIGGAVVVALLCTVVPGARRTCQKQFMSADGFKKRIDNTITDLASSREGKSAEQISKINERIAKLRKQIGQDKDGQALTGDEVVEVKDGVFFTAYDKTIGKLVRKIKKSDDANKKVDESSEASDQTDEVSNPTDDVNSQTNESGE